MSEAPSPSKVKLVELVEAYASAKTTSNEPLIRMAASGLSIFLAGHDVVEIAPVETPEEEV